MEDIENKENPEQGDGVKASPEAIQALGEYFFNQQTNILLSMRRATTEPKVIELIDAAAARLPEMCSPDNIAGLLTEDTL